MGSIKTTARAAGLLYLVLAILGWFSLMYVPGRVIVRGDAAATAANLQAFEPLFRLGIAVGLVSTVSFMLLAWLFYRLFEGVSRLQASLLVILVLVQAPISFVNEVSSLGALLAARGADFLAVFDEPQRDALAMLLLKLHTHGIFVSEVFWGLWLLPFGALVYRSGFLPRVLGVWLLVNGVAYVVLSLIGVLSPASYPSAFQWAFPALLGEVAITLWLVLVGARPRAPMPAALPAGG